MIRSHAGPRRREGIILVVVVSLLALFAAIGLGYVVYSESAATASRLSKEAQVVVDGRAEVEPELILNEALGALIYDKPDDVSGVYSALRGHSLARSMYGWGMTLEYTYPNNTKTYLISSFIPPVSPVPPAVLTNVFNANTTPFNGAGRMKVVGDINADPNAHIDPFAGVAWDRVINFTMFPTDTIVRDPEHYPVDRNPNANPPFVNYRRPIDVLQSVFKPGNRYYGGYNVPYTYPDLNNVYLAAVRASDGKVLIPSFHRPYLFGPMDPENPNWYKASGRLKTLRPRPFDQLTPAQLAQVGINGPIAEGLTPAMERQQSNDYYRKIKPLIDQGKVIGYPINLPVKPSPNLPLQEFGGDVKNLAGAPGGNDSVWMDLGLPVRQTRDGKKYKPLVAFLITDLDGRVNLNVAGNVLGPNGSSISNQGLGRHEINPQRVLTVSPAEYPNLFHDAANVSARYSGLTSAGLQSYYQAFNGRPANYPGYSFNTPANPPPQPPRDGFAPSFLNPPLQQPVFYQQPITQNVANPFWAPPHYRVDLDARNVDFVNGQFQFLRSQAPQAPRDTTGNQAVNPNSPNVLSWWSPMAWASSPDYVTKYKDFFRNPNTALQAPVEAVHSGYGNEGPILPQLPLQGMTPADADQVFTERLNHPFLYNPLRRTGNSVVLNAQEMHRLIGRYASPLDVGESMLARLLPNNLSSPQVRHSVTLLSADLDRPGLVAQTARVGGGLPQRHDFATDHDPTQNPSLNPPTLPKLPFPYAGAGQAFLNASTSVLGPVNYGNTTWFDYAGNPAWYFPRLPLGGRDIPGEVEVVPGYQPASDGRATAAANYGRLDLNRPLRPYPTPENNLANGQYYTNPNDPAIQFAAQDRQQFAREIFDRLCVATGIAPPVPTVVVPLAGPDYDTYKWLAQLAANIVDYIDEDDVMTRFAWHPDVASVAPADLDKFIAWGVERPKLALNEIYIEQTNGDTASEAQYLETVPQPGGQPPKKRARKYMINVWAELHHTLVPPFVNDGASLAYQQFVNRHRVWLNSTVAGQPLNPYKLHLVRGNVADKDLKHTQDPPGPSPDAAGTPKSFNFQGSGADPKFVDPVDTARNNPNDPRAYKARDGVKNAGFLVVGSKKADTVQPHGNRFNSGTPDKSPSIKADSELSFDVSLGTPPNPANAKFEDMLPTVVLQRLADPYRPASPAGTPPSDPTYNPYVTVDMVRLVDGSTSPATPAANLNRVNIQAIKYDHQPRSNSEALPAPDRLTSVGRKQPLAGGMAQLILSKRPPTGTEPAESFFRHNSDQTTPPAILPEDRSDLTPAGQKGLERFDWLVHLDRKLTSPIELIHVAAVPPWELTKMFVNKPERPQGGINEHRLGHTAPWLDEHVAKVPTPTNPGDPASVQQPIAIDIPTPGSVTEPRPGPSARLYRALEFFRVGDRTVEMAFGGRVLGKVNINTIWDKAVFDAVCDAINPPSSLPIYNASEGFVQKDVDSVWAALVDGTYNRSARTPSFGEAGLYDQITGRDLPFWGMGAPHVDAPAPQPSPFLPDLAQFPQRNLEGNSRPFQNAGLDATLFRRIVTSAGGPQPGYPAFNLGLNTPPVRPRVFEAEGQFDTRAPNPLQAVYHPLREQALLAKVFEHLSTRSNVFAVYMTVGYFEVVDDSQKPERLGDEIGVLRDAAGNVVENKAVRHRMFAIVDRTNLSLQPPKFLADGNWRFDGEDLFKQGPAPFYYTCSVTPVPNLANPQTWQIALPCTRFGPTAPNGQVQWASGEYNGATWTLSGTTLPFSGDDPMGRPTASVLYVGQGATQRRLVVKSLTPVPTAGVVLVELGIPRLQPNAPWVPLGDPPAAPVTVSNAVPGNPGPQPDFDHRLPNYRGVVLYSVILE